MAEKGQLRIHRLDIKWWLTVNCRDGDGWAFVASFDSEAGAVAAAQKYLDDCSDCQIEQVVE
jgi:hypothetical protein